MKKGTIIVKGCNRLACPYEIIIMAEHTYNIVIPAKRKLNTLLAKNEYRYKSYNPKWINFSTFSFELPYGKYRIKVRTETFENAHNSYNRRTVSVESNYIKINLSKEKNIITLKRKIKYNHIILEIVE